MGTTDSREIRETVRRRYAERALTVLEGTSTDGACCTGSSCGSVSANLYSPEQAGAVPQEALSASLGCGNPTALASLSEGEVVLDLGSGGGIDVLLSAKRVGPTGFVYGLDMTDEMLELAERNRLAQGATNVSFLKGHIEEVPLPHETVDVVISNCVINLSADKGRVLREAFRVLRPGGLFAVSDVIVQGQIPAELRADMESWVGCVAGALEEGEYRSLLTAAGFDDIDIEVTRVYDPADLVSAGGCCGSTPDAGGGEWGGRLVSAFVRARKP
jgi:SAM-dependent methyltransferase